MIVYKNQDPEEAYNTIVNYYHDVDIVEIVEYVDPYNPEGYTRREINIALKNYQDVSYVIEGYLNEEYIKNLVNKFVMIVSKIEDLVYDHAVETCIDVLKKKFSNLVLTGVSSKEVSNTRRAYVFFKVDGKHGYAYFKYEIIEKDVDPVRKTMIFRRRLYIPENNINRIRIYYPT